MSLKLIGRKYIGFEKALARQAQAFAAVGGAEIELKFRPLTSALSGEQM